MVNPRVISACRLVGVSVKFGRGLKYPGNSRAPSSYRRRDLTDPLGWRLLKRDGNGRK